MKQSIFSDRELLQSYNEESGGKLILSDRKENYFLFHSFLLSLSLCQSSRIIGLKVTRHTNECQQIFVLSQTRRKIKGNNIKLTFMKLKERKPSIKWAKVIKSNFLPSYNLRGESCCSQPGVNSSLKSHCPINSKNPSFPLFVNNALSESEAFLLSRVSPSCDPVDHKSPTKNNPNPPAQKGQLFLPDQPHNITRGQRKTIQFSNQTHW